MVVGFKPTGRFLRHTPDDRTKAPVAPQRAFCYVWGAVKMLLLTIVPTRRFRRAAGDDSVDRGHGERRLSPAAEAVGG